MKYLALITAFGLIGFALGSAIGHQINKNDAAVSKIPKYKVGDCLLVVGKLENWETLENSIVYKVKAVGIEKYLLTYIRPIQIKGSDTDNFILLADQFLTKVECPK